ncbi:MAG: response regulator [Phycisphaerae bacterium]|nr:response regulator [Phycisphaerae bacterium]
MTISRRLILLLTVPLATLVGVGLFSRHNIDRIEARTRVLAEVQTEALATLGQISRVQAEKRINIRSLLLAKNQETRAAALEAYKEDAKELENRLNRYREALIADETDRRLFTEFRESVKAWDQDAGRVIDLLARSDRDEATELFFRTVSDTGMHLSRASSAWIRYNEELARAGGIAAIETAERAKRTALYAGLAGIAVTALLGGLILRSIVKPIRHLRDSVETISRGEYHKPVPFLTARDETGELARSISVLKDGAAATDRQRWVKTHAARILASLQHTESAESFTQQLLTELTPLLGGGVSALLLADHQEQSLRCLAVYGAATEAPPPMPFGRGLAGQCAREQRPLSLSDLPPEYLRVSSGLGSAPPTHAHAWPLIAGGETVAVLELASFAPPTADRAALLDELLPAAALSLQVLLRNLRTRELLEVTQRMTEDLRAQQSTLRASEEQFRTLIESAPDALIITDQDGRMMIVNAQAERLFGFSRDEMLGNPVEMLIPERFRAAHPAKRRGYVADPSVRPMGSGLELEGLRKNGEEFPIEISLSPLNRAGGVRWVACSLRDITERKRAEIELRQARQKAEEATKAKSAFLANMSHEIRTPMNGVIGMTELALDTDLTAEQRDYLNTVKSSAEALLSIINDILDFSKIEAGRIELDPVEFLLRDAVSDTLNPLSLRAGSKGVELAYEVGADVPDALIGDIHRLRQILINLVGNAIKFTEKGEVVVSVSLVSRENDDVTIDFSVRDSGIGISPEAAARLFRPFEQAEASTTRKFGGTGLGLAISRQLAELMGGGIRLESTPGAGSTFSFSVRMKVGTQRSPVSSDDAAHHFRGKCALIVDDNATNRRILETMLANWGLASISAEDGPGALALLDRTEAAGSPVSLMISDLHMPGMDGFELVRAVRQRAATAALPVFMLTSSASPGDQAQSTELNVAARLIKPVKQSLLLDNLVRVLTGAQRRDNSAPAATAPNAAAATTGSLRIILAEDNPVNQKFAVRVLTGAGHCVTIANNGREAVEKSASEPVDVILMDVQMPEMDGLEATRAIRTRESAGGIRVPIIAMTANAMAGDREMCLDAGMDGYVSKPVKKELLFAEIDRVLKGTAHA